MRKAWTKEEDEVLRQYYGNLSVVEIAQRLGRTTNSIYCRARKLGVRAHVPMEVITVNPNLEETKWAYLAGFIDCDGRLGIHWTGKTTQAAVEFVNADEKTISTIKSWLGLNGKLLKIEDHRNEGYCPVYRLVVQRCADVLFLVHKLKPYLIRKKAQAEVLREHCELMLTGKLTRSLRLKLYRRCRELNQSLDTKRYPESRYASAGDYPK